MSAKLKPLDLTGAVVGTTGIIDFNQFVKFQANNLQEKAHLWLFNESGAGVDILFQQSNNSHFLPAGGWGTFEIEPNDGQVKVTVSYVIPAPPVSLLAATYYAPGEKVPQAFTLGNSPIGGGTTSVGSTLSNETATVGTEIIDIGTVANNKLWDIFNDHFVAAVEQAGVRHQVLKGQTAGNPLQIGQAGDITEVLGKLLLDQALNLVISPTSVSGSVSGSIDLYMPLQGTIKLVVMYFNAFRSATSQAIALPTAFTKGLVALVMGIGPSGDGGIEFRIGAAAQTSQIMTAIAASGGSASATTPTNQYSILQNINAGIDTINCLSNTNPHTGPVFIVGI